MPRDLKQSNDNFLDIRDAVSGETVRLYYRMPTSTERAGCMAGKYKREGGKIKSRIFTTLMTYGGRICTGFGEGQFSNGADEKGSPVLISSNPQSPLYFPEWKQLLEETAGDLLLILGQHVFEGRIEIPEGGFRLEIEEETFEEPGEGEAAAGEGEPIPPLPKSSGGSGKPAPRSRK